MQKVTEDGGVKKLILKAADSSAIKVDGDLEDVENQKCMGVGYSPQAGDAVEVNYVGRLAESGKEFDASISGYPFSFCLGKGKVIQGWEFGIPSMKVGETSELYIRSDYGYGKEGDIGKGGDDAIPPDADLIFEVTLVSARPGDISSSVHAVNDDMVRLGLVRKQREEDQQKRKALEEEKKQNKANAQKAQQEKLANKKNKGKRKKKKSKETSKVTKDEDTKKHEQKKENMDNKSK
mmetsp:Transcript_7411/g.9402  ORF Transcript_7411/g.9402 Transcript_7411/m.9402 type:complete len:236 (+) Transcript_7411:366-1073(+)